MERYERGVALFDQENWSAAEREFTAAIGLSLPIAGMYHHRGSAFAEQGRDREAVADYDAAIRLRPDYPDMYVDRGNSYHALELNENALKDYTEAIRLRPNYPEAFANRAVVHADMGDDNAYRLDADEAIARGIDRLALEELLEETIKGREG
jgi:tetratricopeptide (TPR) repeat protein